MANHPFIARRSSVYGWIVALGGRTDAMVAKFGHDEDRARALAADLNSAVASHARHYEEAQRRGGVQ